MRGKITEQAMIMGFHRTKSGDSPLLVDYCKNKPFEGLSINPYLSQNGITVNGKLYKVDTDVTILDSVTTDGTGYFNLGIKPTDNMEVEAEIIPTRSAIGTLMGSGTNDSDLVCFFNQRDADTFRNVHGNYPYKTVDIDIFNFVNKRIKYKTVVTPTEQTTYVNDSLVDTSTFTASGNNVDLYLLGRKFNGSFGSAFVGSLCTMSIKINGADVYKLYAAQKNNVVGVYDLVSGQFIAPTVGTLTAGKATKTINVHSEIPVEQYQEVEYLESSGIQIINTGIIPVDTEYFYIRIYHRNDGPAWGSDNFVTARYENDDYLRVFNTNSYVKGSLPLYNWLEGIYDPSTGVFSIHGNSQQKGSVACTAPMYLFGRASGVKGSARISECIIGERGHFIPVKRLSDDTYGMYDLVLKTFFGNDGTGAFTGGSARQMEVPICTVERSGDFCNPHGEIPIEEYEEVKYLQSSGTQHIRTNKSVNGKVVKQAAKFKCGGVRVSLFGSASNWDSNWTGIPYLNDVGSARLAVGNSSNQDIQIFTSSDWHTYSQVIDDINKTWRTEMDGTVHSGTYSGNIGTMSVYLFAHNTDNSPVARMAGNIAEYEMVVNGVTEIHYIPVKKRSNNEYGMYDLVSRTFFGNSGTGEFTGGEPVTGYECDIDLTHDSTTQTVKIYSDMLQGSIDAVSGLETEQFLHEVIDSNSAFTKNSGVDGLFHHAVVGGSTHNSPPYNVGFCNLFTMANKIATALSDWECTMNGSMGANARISFKVPAGMFSTAEEFKQFALAIGLEFWTDKATPSQSQGESHSIQGISGNMTAECKQSKSITAKYRSNTV